MARGDLPASLAGTVVILPEDHRADRAEHAKGQVTEGLAQVGISGMVQHSEYTFECAGWVGAANVRPNLFWLLGCFLPPALSRGRVPLLSLHSHTERK
jgi:hypothetical protein